MSRFDASREIRPISAFDRRSNVPPRHPWTRTLSALCCFCCFCLPIEAGTLSVNFSPIATGSNVNLTMSGKVDWVHWGLYTVTSVDRKSCATPMISDFSLVGDIACSNCVLTAYQYGDNANGYTWYDGNPDAAVTNTPTGVWAYNYPIPTGSGFQFTVPADTAAKTLQVYVGAYAAQGQFTASLSDNSALPFASGNAPNQTVDNALNGPGGVFSCTFAANSSNQLLTVSWKVGSPRGLGPNVTLQAATLTAAGANNPPFVLVTNPVNHASFAEPATITITATAQDFDGAVTNVSFYANNNLLGLTATSPYSLIWSNVPRGRYTLSAYANDNGGAISCSKQVDVFVYGAGGSEQGSVAFPLNAVDLSYEGTLDWGHWGLVTNTNFDRMDVLPELISNITALGTNQTHSYTDNYTAFSWSNGTPTPQISGTRTGVYIGGVTNGFALSALADRWPRILRLYVGGYGLRGEFQAYLSDFSAAPYIDNTTISNQYGNAYAVYTINYRAASSNQTLLVFYRSADLYDLAYGNATIQAATLQKGPPVPFPVQIFNPLSDGSEFVFSFDSQSNFDYLIQSADALINPNWMTLTTILGTGGPLTVTNWLNGSQRFYRVQTQ